MKGDIEFNEQVLMLMTKLHISKESAEEMVELAMNDPETFDRRRKLIQDVRDAPDARPVKGVTLHHTRHRIGRNAQCPCGSGKKFKKCKCFKQDRKIGYIIHRVEEPEKPKPDNHFYGHVPGRDLKEGARGVKGATSETT